MTKENKIYWLFFVLSIISSLICFYFLIIKFNNNHGKYLKNKENYEYIIKTKYQKNDIQEKLDMINTKQNSINQLITEKYNIISQIDSISVSINNFNYSNEKLKNKIANYK